MERLAKSVRLFFKRLSRSLIPHFRQFLRFLGLPYCFFFLIDWKACKKSPLIVAGDLLYIFFVLRYFPDNYSNCHLYEKPRRDWVLYYGSNYNPFQRSRLSKVVQPPEFSIVFEDKEICQSLCESHGFSVPRMVGTLSPGRPLKPQLEALLNLEPDGEFFAKPAMGAAGNGIFKIRKIDQDLQMSEKMLLETELPYSLFERHILQAKVDQDVIMAGVYPGSLNSVRIITLMTRDDTPLVVSAFVRFGTGYAEIDNWSAGGVAVGVDCATGSLFKTGFNKKGRPFLSHPDTHVEFQKFQIPQWPNMCDFARQVQAAFPYFRLLGLDVALGSDDLVLIEINAYPDFVAQEQCAGPLLKDPCILREFAAYELLFNRPQKMLYRNLEHPHT